MVVVMTISKQKDSVGLECKTQDRNSSRNCSVKRKSTISKHLCWNWQTRRTFSLVNIKGELYIGNNINGDG